MTSFIFFIIGLLIGGLIGVTMMCLFQINRMNKISYKKEDGDNE